jgi:predicted dehydrogenase
MKFLVVGCGSIGRRHLRNLRALGEADLLAYDPAPERRAEAARSVEAREVDSLEKGLAAGIDACLICSPSALHAAQAVAALPFCHLFIEKPLANTSAEAARVAEAVAATSRVCLVACNLRFHPGVVCLKRELDAGVVGRLLSVRAEFGQYLPDWHPWEDYRRGYSARRDLGGGIVLDAIHELDLVRWLAGDFATVRAVRGRAGDLEIDTEDIGLLIGRTNGGVWCEVHLDYLQRSFTRTCKVIGTEGTLVWDAREGTTTLLGPKGPPATLCDFRNLDANAMYLDEMRHFLGCLRGEGPPAQDARAGAEVVRVAEQFRWLENAP